MIKNTLLRLSNAYKKYGKNIKIRHNHKEALNQWYKKYEAKELDNEMKNYPWFQKIILEELLGYKLEVDFKFAYSLDSRNVEFMIILDGEPYIPIELKGSDVNLDSPYHGGLSPVEQASNYANKRESIKWFIVSNYYEFRLYNQKSQDKYIQFNLDDLRDENTLKDFLLCFSKQSILEEDIISKLYDSRGLFATDYNLENEFYKLYSQTRLMLIKELEYSNDIGRDEAISYAQLIMNRYIFICFAEDKDLLPDNTSSMDILTPIKNHNLRRGEIWHRLNGLFIDLFDGNPEKGITDYNGGLFREDLTHLRIRDKTESEFYDDIKISYNFPEQTHIIMGELKQYPLINKIYRNLLIISSFDFDSDIDVNILGHIFENSINDIEEIREEKVSKRKKDGVYYTPEEITTYICENTIIPYLSKTENKTIAELIEEYEDDLNELVNKLENIKIVDPACGSGAFLNKAMDTLLEIHRAIHKTRENHQTSLESLDETFSNIDNRRKILLNNIYGVDINKESIEITKLGLFLKVAQKGVKLPNLDKNIVCGNSLIDDPEYTDQPFNWEEEFHEVMDSGGFDIVIGNPPYVDIKELNDDNFVNYIFKNYETSSNRINLYSTFVEKGLTILKNNGYFAFIIPNSILFNSSYELIRYELLSKTCITNIVKLRNDTFLDAKVEPIILVFKKNNLKKSNNKTSIKIFYEDKTIEHEINQEKWLKNKGFLINIYATDEILNLIKKIEDSKNKLIDFGDFSLGITPYDKYKGMSKEDIKNKVFHSNTKKSNTYRKLLKGSDITRYNISWNGEEYINYGIWLAAPREQKFFIEPRILVRQILTGNPKRIFCSYTKDELYNTQSIFNILSNKIDLNIIVAILNSKLMSWYHSEKFIDKNEKLFPKILIENVKKFPITIPNEDQEKNIKKLVIEIIAKNKELHNEIQSFHKYLKRDFNITKINRKLTEYYNLSFEELYKQIKKQYKEISRKEADKLEKEFLESVNIIKPLQNEITIIDEEIDKLVYKLYDLTGDEIEIIENEINEDVIK
ncbi:MAG: N-6 DNA methylase [Methanobrevibacter sp. CfCl-M3]